MRTITPNTEGFFGNHGGNYMPEVFIPTIEKLRDCFLEESEKESFKKEYLHLLSSYSCRPTPLTYLKNISEKIGGPKIFVKREDLNHTGSHKFNNVMGQGLLAKKLGKTRVIAETGAGQHGVATATMAAKLGFECVIYMGEEDVKRQYPNVFWMKKLGAKVIAVTNGTKTLKDAMNEATRDWSASFETTHYVIGTACGCRPFPEMVVYFQSIIGEESRKQILESAGRLPDRVYACVGGGSNALGIFMGFIDDPVRLIAAEAGGKGIETGLHASRIAGGKGSIGVAQGYKTYFLQNKDGQMNDTYSIAAGLDYIGISPILADLGEKKRVEFVSVTDIEVQAAFDEIMKTEGLIPAMESSHGFAAALRDAAETGKNEIFLINQSGRADKDIFQIAETSGDDDWKQYLKERINHA